MNPSHPDGNDPDRPPQTDRHRGPKEEAQDKVAQWQQDVKRLLTRLAPYFVAGRIVTFENITAEEKSFYAQIVEAVAVPPTVCAVFIPPSVIQQAMWPGIRRVATEESSEVYSIAPDAGAVVAVHCGSLATIVNALFALPPLAPGIDVYQGGRLLAGYTFNDHRECAEGLRQALKTYLQ